MQANPQRKLTLKVLSIVVLILDVLILLFVAVMMPATAASFRGVFRDMNRELPGLTQFFLGMPPLVYPVVWGGLAIALIVKEFLIRPSASLLVNIILLPLPLVTGGAYFLSLFMPMMAMLRAMQG